MQSRAALCKIINVEINARGNTRREKEEEEGKKNKITNVLKGEIFFLRGRMNRSGVTDGYARSGACIQAGWGLEGGTESGFNTAGLEK